jgi:hypothetical protein
MILPSPFLKKQFELFVKNVAPVQLLFKEHVFIQLFTVVFCKSDNEEVPQKEECGTVINL